jgi:tetratricopeptide (TPR) repeat protein
MPKTSQHRIFIENLPTSILWPCVLVIVLLTHASYINNGFTWLDHGDLEQGRAILPLAELHKAFTQPFGETGFYRPLVTILHSLDAAIYGDWAPGFHLTNVLLHLAAVASATLFVAVFFSLSPKEGLLAAFIFGIHPLTWLPAGAISYRPELLATSLTFLTLFFHIKTRQAIASSPDSISNISIRKVGTRKDGKGLSGSPLKFLIATLFCLLFALLAKETPLFWIPALIISWEIFRIFGQKKSAGTAKKDEKTVAKNSRFAMFVFGSEITVLGLYAALRTAAIPEIWHATSTTLGFSEAIGTRLQVLGLRMLEWLSPFKPALSDATPIQGLPGFSSLATLAILIGTAALVWRAGCNSPVSRIFAFLAIALLPALNIVPLPRFSSPHYGYFAAIAFGVMVVELVRTSNAWPQAAQKLLLAGISAWILLAAATTFLHGDRFKNDLTLFEPEVAQDENFLEGHFYLGDAYMQFGDPERAANAYQAALRPKPDVLAYLDRSSAMINYAGVLLEQGKPDDAQKILLHVSGNVSASEQQLVDYNLALIANQQRDYVQVVDLLEKHRPGWQRPQPLMMLANALRQLQRTQEAVETLRLALPFLDAQQRAKVLALIEASK